MSEQIGAVIVEVDWLYNEINHNKHTCKCIHIYLLANKYYTEIEHRNMWVFSDKC